MCVREFFFFLQWIKYSKNILLLYIQQAFLMF